VLFTSDDGRYGGYDRIDHDPKSAFMPGMDGNFVRLHLAPRTCMVLKPQNR
jgi:hypothetical protein